MRAVKLRALLLLLLATALMWALAATAHAQDELPPQDDELLLTSLQYWAAILGAIAPLAGYLINKHAPWVHERVKFFVQVVLAAATGSVYQLIQTDSWAFDTQTFQTMGIAVFAALFMHRFGWLPSEIAQMFGSGQNNPRTARQAPPQQG